MYSRKNRALEIVTLTLTGLTLSTHVPDEKLVLVLVVVFLVLVGVLW
jgi:hypothetical protein